MQRLAQTVGAALLGLVLGSPSNAQEIERVPYSELAPQLVALIDFEDLPRRPSPGQVLDGVAEFEGARIAERFQGQLVRQQGGFDQLELSPVAPLSLTPGAPGENLAVEFIYYLSNQLMGTAPPGFPDRSGGGEGAVSILFDRDQSALGFRVASEPEPKTPAPKGRMEVTFFRRDSSLIAAMEVELDWMYAGYGFQRTSGTEDIAGISITNRDPQGVMIDDVIFDRNIVLGWVRH